jgi:hypothetical protein
VRWSVICLYCNAAPAETSCHKMREQEVRDYRYSPSLNMAAQLYTSSC